MSISIRTLKIVIGILVLVSMILSMVPMFGMGTRAVRALARPGVQLGRTAVPAVSKVPRLATQPSLRAPQAHTPSAYPRYNGSSEETYPMGTLGVKPAFPEPPILEPVPEVPRELPQLPATALLPGAAFGAPQIPVKQQAKPESEKEVIEEPAAEEQIPTQTASSFKPKVILPAKPAPKYGEEEIVEILEDGTIKTPEKTPDIKTGEAQIPQTQQTGHVLSPTPADTHQLVNRAEAVREYAPVMGGTQVSKGELGRAISAMSEETITPEQTKEAETQQSVIFESGTAKQVSEGTALKSTETNAAPITNKQTEQPEVRAAVEYGATPQPEQMAGAVSSNAETATAATTAAGTAAIFVGAAVNTESQNRIRRAAPQAGTTAERVVKPDTTTFSAEKGNADATNRLNESRHRGTVKNVAPDASHEFRRGATTNPKLERSTLVEDARRGNDGNKNNNGGSRGLRHRAPVRPGIGGPVAGTAALGLIPYINLGDDEEEESDSDSGSVRPIPMPRVHPRPQPVVDLGNANNLPPERVQKRSAFDDLEDKVIKDKNKMYSDRFDNLRRADSLVEQVLPLLQDVPASLEKPAREFIESYGKVNVQDAASYGEFINAYNNVMDAIRRERETTNK
ncbi:MAG: hypothetical protein ACHQVS_01390 [Candidatus Babeliales bacterium]